LKAKEFLLPQLEQELSALQAQHEKALPLMRFFEGKEGIEHLFQDMQHSLEHTGYLMIKAFVSNTLQAQSFSGQVLDDFGHDFFEYCKKHQISIQALRGQGILMLEQIDTTMSLDDIRKAPAGAGSVCLFLIGEVLYILILKNIPFGCKIQSDELAQVMHVLMGR
jgi:hypothetical protein